VGTGFGVLGEGDLDPKQLGARRLRNARRAVVCARFRRAVWISFAPKGAISRSKEAPEHAKAEEGALADPHQAISIIATALCDARKDRPDHAMRPEEATQIAKCIVEALSDAGLQIAPVRKD
jgi:hypothetical protein